jgi:hypothetical protein
MPFVYESDFQVALKRVSNDEGIEFVEYEETLSRLSIEAVLLRKAAGPNVASFLGLLRLDGELTLAM